MSRSTSLSFVLPILLAAFAVLGRPAPSMGQDEARQHVCLIQVISKGAPGKGPTFKSLTGFRVKDAVGIITALHGVNGLKPGDEIQATFFSLKAPDSERVFRNLQVKEVDIERDLAKLSSAQLEKLGLRGMEIARDVDWAGLEKEYQKKKETLKVSVIGFPINRDFKDDITNLDVGSPPLQPVTVMAQKFADEIKERKSPKEDLPVLAVKGFFLPGHSGAPILNSDQKVVAVGLGGLPVLVGDKRLDAASGTGWGVPLDKVKWASTKDKVEELKQTAEKGQSKVSMVRADFEAVQEILQQFRVATVIEGEPGAVLKVLKQSPTETGKGIAKVLKDGEPLGALDFFFGRKSNFTVAAGTEVKILDEEVEFKLPENLPKAVEGVLDQAGKNLGGDLKGVLGGIVENAVETNFVKVRIMDGQHRGQEGWVCRDLLKLRFAPPKK
jgi:hypothetical protein